MEWLVIILGPPPIEEEAHTWYLGSIHGSKDTYLTISRPPIRGCWDAQIAMGGLQ